MYFLKKSLILYMLVQLHIDSFYKLWTLKECVLKAQGTGFLTSPIEVLTLENPVRISGDCFYTHHTFMNDYSLSVAASIPSKNVYLSRIELPG